MKEDKVPLNQVLDDMYDPNGGMVADAARTYYYENYASPEERARMDREDKRRGILCTVAVILYVGFVVGTIIYAAISGQII